MNATQQTSITLRTQAQGTAAGDEALKAYLGTCPTCCAGPGELTDEYDASVAPAACPTCGQVSVEYGMLIEMDAILTNLRGLDALASAIDSLA